MVAGKGLGLRATRDLMPGELVMVSRPLGVVYGPSGRVPFNAELAGAVSEAAAARGQPDEEESLAGGWIQLLRTTRGGGAPHETSGGGSDGGGDGLSLARALLLGRGGDGGETASADGADEAGALSEMTGAAGAATHVSEAVSCNSYGEPCEDVAVAELRVGLSCCSWLCSRLSPIWYSLNALLLSTWGGQQCLGTYTTKPFWLTPPPLPPSPHPPQDTEPLAFNGLWPEFALLNHSCAPNTSALVVGGRLLLRAARPVLEGDELTTSYLGQARFGHAAERRAALAADYGFHCQCSRCEKMSCGKGGRENTKAGKWKLYPPNLGVR